MSHLYKLQIGLETIIKTKYFMAFIIANSNGFNSSGRFICTSKVFIKGNDKNILSDLFFIMFVEGY